MAENADGLAGRAGGRWRHARVAFLVGAVFVPVVGFLAVSYLQGDVGLVWAIGLGALALVGMGFFAYLVVGRWKGL